MREAPGICLLRSSVVSKVVGFRLCPESPDLNEVIAAACIEPLVGDRVVSALLGPGYLALSRDSYQQLCSESSVLRQEQIVKVHLLKSVLRPHILPLGNQRPYQKFHWCCVRGSSCVCRQPLRKSEDSKGPFLSRVVRCTLVKANAYVVRSSV